MRMLWNLLLPIALLLANAASASDGDMDTTFGSDLGASGGQFLRGFNAGASNYDSPSAMLSAGDGGYVLVGNADGMIGLMQIDTHGVVVRAQETSILGSPIDAVRDANGHILTLWYNDKVVRFNSDFSLDTSYGDSGVVTVPNMQGYYSPDFQAIALDHSGRIIVAGTAGQFGTTNLDMVVARLMADGSLDDSFGTSGQTAIAFDLVTDGYDVARRIAIAPDDSIALAGQAQNTAYEDFFDVAVVRLQTNGTRDLSFNGNGKRTINLGAAPECCGPSAVAFDQSGRIVIAGFAANSGFVTRLLASGQDDTMFQGTNPGSPAGMALTDIGPKTLALSSNGRILVGGFTPSACTRNIMAIERLTSTGAEDLGFNDGSSVKTISFGECANTSAVWSWAYAMLLDAARPVLFGSLYHDDNSQSLWAVARLQSDLIFTNRFGD